MKNAPPILFFGALSHIAMLLPMWVIFDGYQDMMTMINRALSAAKKNNAESTADLSKFADNEKIAAYARDSFSKVVAEGIITGDGKNINPLSNTTRAEAAVVVYRLLNK